MVGGPLHGQTKQVPANGHPPTQINVARRPDIGSFVVGNSTAPDTLTDWPHRYELRWYQGWVTWPPAGPEARLPAYLCMDPPSPSRLPQDDVQAHYRCAVADGLWHAAEDAALPSCVVPGCDAKGRMVFTADESGRLARRDWQRGDQIRVCPAHAHDIYRAQGARGMSYLADWLRDGATWDWIDAYDSGELRYGAERLERSARMLRLRYPR